MGRISNKAESSNTQDVIINTAEKLFAENGIKGVALRAISQASGQGNSVAVQYHFKNREGLVSAILGRRIAEIESRRDDLLKSLLLQSADPTLVQLLKIIQQPLIDMVDEQGIHTFARFLLSCYAATDYWSINTGFGVRAWMGGEGIPAGPTKQTLDLISAALPQLPPRILAWRISDYIRSLVITIVGWENAYSSGQTSAPLCAFMEERRVMTAAALSAPMSDMAREYIF